MPTVAKKSEVKTVWTLLGLRSTLGRDLAKEIRLVERQTANLRKIGQTVVDFGKKLTVGMTAVIAGVGALVMKSAYVYDDANDLIRATTGKTGVALAGLNKSFDNLMKTMPNAPEQIAEAVAVLNQRMGAMGPALDDLAKRYLAVARMTKTEVTPTIEQGAKAFSIWRVATEDQTGALDQLWRIHQKTGIAMGRLLELMTQYGPLLQALGFTWEQSAALMGQFEQAGINTENAMMGLRTALAKMASEGITNPAQALQIIIDKIKAAGSEGEAAALGIAAFGTRAGVGLANAIRNGQLELDKFLDSLGSDTILKAAADTMSLGEKMDGLKNKLTGSFVPLAERLVPILETRLLPILDRAIGFIERMSLAFAKLSPGTQDFIIKALGIAAALGPVLVVVGSVISSIGSIVSGLTVFKSVGAGLFGMVKGFFTWLTPIMSANPWVIIIAGVIAAVVLLIKHWDDVKAAFVNLWSHIKPFVQPLIDFVTGIVDKIKQGIAWLKEFLGLSDQSGVTSPGASRASLTVEAYAEGGIVTKPTLAMIGEDGPEAVVPLKGKGLSEIFGLGGGKAAQKSGSGYGFLDYLGDVLRLIQARYDNLSSSMGWTEDSAEGLRAREESLGQQIEVQTEVVAQYRKQVEALAAAHKLATQEGMAAQIALQEQQKTLAEMTAARVAENQAMLRGGNPGYMDTLDKLKKSFDYSAYQNAYALGYGITSPEELRVRTEQSVMDSWIKNGMPFNSKGQPIISISINGAETDKVRRIVLDTVKEAVGGDD